jgi:hypothetical protein
MEQKQEQKTCDGFCYLFGQKQKATLYLIKDKNNVFSYDLINEKNQLVYTEILTKRKNPIFRELSFMVTGIIIFESEKECTARFNDMKNYFYNNFDIKYEYLVYNQNYYEGESKDNIPNGQGILYYGQTRNIMIKGRFENGQMEGPVVLYTEDQNIELVCDDVCNMRAVQYGTILFKNLNLQKDVDFSDFNNDYKYLSLDL